METTEIMGIMVIIAFIIGVFVGYAWQSFSKDNNMSDKGTQKPQD